MFEWLRKYVKKIGIFGVEVEFHPPQEIATHAPKPLEDRVVDIDRPTSRKVLSPASSTTRQDWDDKKIIEKIRCKFDTDGKSANVPLLTGENFEATLIGEGIKVSNLSSNKQILEWRVFQETVRLLNRKGGRADRGNAMNAKLGDAELPLDSIEGHIAQTCYNVAIGESVRRITPIACILIWAGIAEALPGSLRLR